MAIKNDYSAVDGSGKSYTLRLAGRRGEALERFWAKQATAEDTLNASRGLPAAVPPSVKRGKSKDDPMADERERRAFASEIDEENEDR